MAESEDGAMNQPTEPSAVPFRQRTWRRRLPLLLAGFVALIILLVAVTGYRFSVARQELASAIAEADRLDPGWRFEDLESQRRLPPPKQNAALHVLKVQSLLPTNWPYPPTGGRDEDANSKVEPWTLSPKQELTELQVRWLRANLQRAKPALDQAQNLTDMPEGGYPVTWAIDIISTPSPWLGACFSTSLLLYFEALLRGQDEDPDGALLCARAVLNVGRSFGDEPFLHAALSHDACRGEAARSVERTLAQGRPSESALAAMQKAVEEEDAVPLFLAHFRGERAFWHVFLTRVDEGKNRMSEISCVPARGFRAHVETWLGRLEALRMHAHYLRGMNEAAEIAKLPLEQQHPHYQQWRKQWRRVDEVGDGLRIAGRWPEVRLLSRHAMLRCTAVALAAERFRLKHGDWPRALGDLVPNYLKGVPLDPFDAAPLRYRRTDEGVIIYSVGEDGQDDGGDASPRHREYYDSPADIVFTLWNVDRRRQPPKPPL
jgi:hypothetical protein